MAEITAAAVQELRALTNLPMMACKKALIEANGDQKQAIEVLKREAGKVTLARKDNPTEEGRIFTLVAADGGEGAMVEVQCESPPVATGQDLAKFGELAVKQLLEGPGAATPEDLLAQKPAGQSKTLAEMLDDMRGTIREKIVMTRVARVKGPVGAYVHHNGKLGVLFEADGDKQTAPILRDVAMHVVALNPTVSHPEELESSAVEAERAKLREEAKKSGKPDNIIEKIVDGRMKVFYNDSGVLTAQAFAKDDTKTVSQALAESGLKARTFTRWVIGRR